MGAAQALDSCRSDGAFVTVKITNLRVGATLQSPIYDDRDDRDVLLLAAGTTITTGLLERLAARNISRVRVNAADLSRLAGATTRIPEPLNVAPRAVAGTKQRSRSLVRDSADGIASHGDVDGTAPTGSSSWTLSGNSFVHRVRQHGSSPYDSRVSQKFSQDYQQSMVQIDSMFDSLSSGSQKNANAVVNISRDSLLKISEDLDLFVSLGVEPAADKYPSRHSLQTAMLAMAIGTNLGLTQGMLHELGLGCLLHDVGMLRTDQKLYETDRALDSIEFLAITKHPLVTFDLIRNLKEIPTGSRMVAYQMHERYDGSGYPRRRRGKQIHHLARIAAVADVFIALISPRPHRPGKHPYAAMEDLIQGVRDRQFDPIVVRGLLKTVSLFPLGSYVETQDGSVAKAIRANGDAYTKPVVELWEPGNITGAPTVVDLSKESGLRIVRPLAKPRIYEPVA